MPNEEDTTPGQKYAKAEKFTDTLLRLVADSPYSAAAVIGFIVALVLFGVWISR